MVKTPLVLQPQVLVVAIVFMIRALICCRHGHDDVGRLMPHERLKELVTPTDTQFTALVDMIPFGLCLQGQSDAGKKQNSYDTKGISHDQRL